MRYKLRVKLDLVQAALSAVLGGVSPESLEDQGLDFKQDPATVPAPNTPGNPPARLVEIMVEAVVCFANAQGGYIVLGVADTTSGPAALFGTNASATDLRKKIFNNTRPNLPVEIAELEVAGARLLVVYVAEGLDLYTDSRGRANVRQADNCQPLPEEDRRALAHQRRDPDPTGRPTATQGLVLDPLAVEQARTLLRSLNDARRDLADLSVDDLLRRLGLVDDDGKLLLAAEILLARPTRPSAVYLYRESPGAEPGAERLALPLVLAHTALLERVAARRRTELGRVQLPNGQELAIPDFPEIAVDEAITNALAHRDYGPTDPVVVDHSPQVLRVWSPGGLPPGVTPDRLLATISRPRNNALMSAARTLGIAESTSRGVDRMYREMIRTGRDAPEIRVDDFSVEVIFTSGAPNQAFAAFASSLAPELRDNVQVLLTLVALSHARALDIARAADLLQVSPAEAGRVLEWLASPAVGLLELSGSRRGQRTAWRLAHATQAGLGTAITYRTRVGEGDTRVIAHVREYGWVTNKTVRNLFNLDLRQARMLITDMRDRGILEKDSAGPERGPGIRWLPGPRFPAPKGR